MINNFFLNPAGLGKRRQYNADVSVVCNWNACSLKNGNKKLKFCIYNEFLAD